MQNNEKTPNEDNDIEAKRIKIDKQNRGFLDKSLATTTKYPL
jgi:hypothetical protein